MKALLAGVNAKYIHTSLSVRTIASYVNGIDWKEYNINESAESVCADIYRQRTDAVLFSCYIWNIEFILKTARRLKSVAPDTLIIFGGPEVSYADTEYMEKYDFIDAVIRGEGEETVKEFIRTGNLNIRGITYRNGKIIKNPDRPVISDITKIPFPYTDEDIELNKNKLIYYETSRGCPFNCSYCLSSADRSVRFRDLDTVLNELKFFINHKVKIVKFTDRTFNASKKRTHAILEFLIANAAETTFHFEVAADILDDKTMELLGSAPKGLFQLEIGVQSTNMKTLAAIDRKTDLNKIAERVRQIRSFGNIYTHLDLIAGLPYENYESFKNSFNEVFAMQPHVIQLGFLKLLRGTKIRREEQSALFTAEPPYEVLQTDYISYDELLRLKAVEDVVEKYYNSGAFENSVSYLVRQFNSPFEMFEKIACFYEKNGYDKIGISRDFLYRILFDFVNDEKFTDILLYDYLLNNKPRTPEWASRKPVIKERFEILTPEFIEKELPEYSQMTVKEIIKRLYFERFFNPERILIFDNAHNRVIQKFLS